MNPSSRYLVHFAEDADTYQDAHLKRPWWVCDTYSLNEFTLPPGVVVRTFDTEADARRYCASLNRQTGESKL